MSATVTTTTTTSQTLPVLKSRPPKIDFSSINPNNIGTLRKLNQVLFPIKYSEKFYKDVLLSDHEPYCKLIYYNDIPVGTVCCRLETDPTNESNSRLYIMTMGVLAPYRSRKAGTRALQHIIANAEAHNSTIKEKESAKVASAAGSTPSKPIARLYMHVQTSNVDARRFYEREGFKEIGRVDGYYKKLEPRDAWVLERFLIEEEAPSAAE